MRTTLTLDDDVFRAIKSLARSEEKTLGQVVSELVRRALEPSAVQESRRGFPVFSVPPGTPPLTAEMVRRALEED